jgi:uncharacterized OsmC-like protein
MLDVSTQDRINGIDVAALQEVAAAISGDHTRGLVEFSVATEWTGQTRSETTVTHYMMGGERIDRRFKIVADEPLELLGTNSAPNPQELLMAAVNACMTVGYVSQAAIRGIALSRCRITMEGELDLRGFLGIDPAVRPGYGVIKYQVSLEGDGTQEQFEQIHAAVQATSPNYFNMTNAIEMHGTLV